MATRTLVASYAFTGTQDTVLDSASWLQTGRWAGMGGDVVYSPNNGFYGATDSSQCFARWNGAGTFTDDQYSSFVIQNIQDDWTFYLGAAARMSPDAGTTRDAYYVIVQNRQFAGLYETLLQKAVNDVVTTIDSTPNVLWAAGDRVEIECEGTTIRALQSGVEVQSAVDSALTTGRPGILAVQRNPNGFYGDNWEAGNLSTGGGGIAGTLSAALAGVAVAAAGRVAIAGSLSTSLAGASLASTAKITISGSVASTLADVALSSGATLAITGSLTQTLESCLLASDGSQTIVQRSGGLSVTLDDSVLAGSAAIRIDGNLSTILQDVSLVSAADMAIAGSLAVTLGDVVLSANNNVEVLFQVSRVRRSLFFTPLAHRRIT